MTRRKQNIFAFFLIALSVTVLLWPFLSGKNVIAQKYVIDCALPFNAYVHNHFSGDLPLWFESYSNGFPAYLTQTGHYLNAVIIVLLKIFDYITAYNLFIFFNFLVSGAATYLLARKLGMSLRAGIIACFVYIFSHISVWAQAITGLGIMLSFMPVFLLCVLEIHKARELPERRYELKIFNWFAGHKKICLMLLSSLLLALAWISGYVEGILYIAVMGQVFALFLDAAFYFKNKDTISFLKCFKTTFAVLAVILLGTLLASSYMVPVMNFLDNTRRGDSFILSNSQTLSVFFENSTLRLDKVIQLFYPYFSVPYSGYIPFLNTAQEDGYLYVGILPLFLGALALLNARKNKASLFFASFFIFTLLTFLPYVPLNWLLHKLPVFNLFRDYWKWVYAMVFCWAMLAGFGFDAVKDLYETKKLKRLLGFFEVLFLSLLGLAVFVNLFFIFFKDKIMLLGQNYFNARMGADIGLQDATAVMNSGQTRGLMEQALNHMQQNVSFLNPWFFITSVIVLLSLVVFTAFRKGWISLKKFEFFCVALVLLNFIAIWQGFYKSVPSGLLLNPPQTIKFLNSVKPASEPFRVVRFPLSLRYNLDYGIGASDIESRVEMDIALLAPSYNLYYDIDSIFAGDGFRPLRHERMASYAIGGLEIGDAYTKSTFEGVGQKMSEDDRIQILSSSFSRDLLSMMNIKYLLTPLELPAPWILVHRSVVTRHEIPVYIYENSEVMPRVYFAKNIKTVPEGDGSAFVEMQKIKSFRDTTIIECKSTLCLNAGQIKFSPQDEIKIEKKDFDYLKLKTKTKAPRWLINSQSNLPTWEVRIDGKKTEIYTANYIYQGIYVPAGDHEIEYRYPGFFGQFYYSVVNLINKSGFLAKIFGVSN
jgi:hypothetical protein